MMFDLATEVRSHCCPNCGSAQTRIKKRYVRVDGSVLRLRRCKSCGRKFSTVHANSERLPRVERLRAAVATEKRCSSCKRTLPVECFGKLQNDNVLYRANCRERLNSKRAIHGFKKVIEKHGLTESQFADLMAKQDGLCAICRQPGKGKGLRLHPLCIDHCHATGKVRGLLCDRCNLGIGNFDDDPARLEAAAAYVRRHQNA